MVHFVGAGSGAADLITVRGSRLLGEADVIIYDMEKTRDYFFARDYGFLNSD